MLIKGASMFLEFFIPFFAGTLGIGLGVIISLVGLTLASAAYTKISG